MTNRYPPEAGDAASTVGDKDATSVKARAGGRPGQGVRDEWRMNWPVVLAAFAGMAVSTINTYSTGIFIQPLQAAFGWSRAEITFGHVFNAIVCVLASPLVGAVTDRAGPRWIGLGGALALLLLTAALGSTGPGIASWWGVFLLISFANTCIVPMVWTSAVAARFDGGRGFALAVALSGAGLGSLVTPPLSLWLIDAIGWRAAYPALAAIWAVAVLPPIALFLRGGPRGQRLAAAPLATVAREDLLTWRFARLALATLLIALVSVTFAATAFPLLTANGLTRGAAAGVVTLLGIAAIAGRLMVGVLLDRWPAPLVGAGAVTAPILGCGLLIALPGSVPAATAAVVLLGLALGSELDVVSYLCSRIFARARFATVFGTIVSFVTLAGGTGPFIASAIFDAGGSYRPALWAALPMCFVSAMLFLSLQVRDQSIGAR